MEWAVEDLDGIAFAVASGDKIIVMAVDGHLREIRLYVGDLSGKFELKKTISNTCPFVVWNRNTVGYAELNGNRIYIYDVNSNEFKKVYTTKHTIAPDGWRTSTAISSKYDNYVITYRATDGNVYLATFNQYGYSNELKLYELGDAGIGGLTLLTDNKIIG